MKVLPSTRRSPSLSPPRDRFDTSSVEHAKFVTCSRCRNHGFHSRLKGHKNVCPFRACLCSHCSLITKRKMIDKKYMDLNNSLTAGIRESFNNMKVSMEETESSPPGSRPSSPRDLLLDAARALSPPKKSMCHPFMDYSHQDPNHSTVQMRVSCSFPSQISNDGSPFMMQTRICQTTWTYAYDKPVSSCFIPPPSSTCYSVCPDDYDREQRNRSVVIANLRKIFPKVERSIISHYYHLSHGDVWRTFNYLNEARHQKNNCEKD